MEYFHPYHGGVERLFKALAAEVAQEKDIQVTVLTADYSGLLANEHVDGIRIIRLKCANRYQFSIKAIKASIKLSKHCDLIHTTTYNASFPAWIAAKIRRKPIVLTLHEYWGNLWWQLPYLNFVQRAGFYLFEQLILTLNYDKVVAVSQYTQERFSERFNPKRAKLIYNGLAPKQPRHDRDLSEDQYYLYVGRLGVSKGLPILVPAMKIVCEKLGIRVKLVIPKKPTAILNALHELLKEPIQNGQANIYHDVDDEVLTALISNAKAVLVPSISEGFGFVALEASMLGTPIIHSGKGALNEVCSGKVIVFEPYTVNGLVEAIERSEVDDFNPIASKIFSLEDMTRAYLTTYTALIANSNRSKISN